MSLSAEENYRLLCEIEANRAMLLQAYRQLTCWPMPKSGYGGYFLMARLSRP
ncbi:hypothetical protein [Sterolibacterium denitrificans]|uniref:hypothetical protein n=1 Tax=Sterolibacterium denitrificans TaxID=157592 RepID=UPI0012B6AC10|nr:hypothetical protein [Sterolibacterium denitrificans]